MRFEQETHNPSQTPHQQPNNQLQTSVKARIYKGKTKTNNYPINNIS
jgi:hypothetical protein